MRLLVVEDQPALARSIAQGLREEGFAVDVSGDGEEALHLGSEIAYDAIVLDRMLPSMDGLSVLRQLRARRVKTPVLLLTALGEVHDRVDGLQGGADDYLVKPFAFAELLARLQALTRRSGGHASNRLELGRLGIDLDARRATLDGRPLELTSREFGLLRALAMKPGVTLSRTQLAERLYEEDDDKESNVIEVFVARLRRKLDAAGLDGGALVRTVRGEGYRFEPPA